MLRASLLLISLLTQTALAATPLTRPAGEYPFRTITNGQVRMLIYLPDARRGLYRGARFDWSGMIGRVQYKGHVFYAPWKTTPHDPGNHDDVIGPTTEFGMPGHVSGALGYAQAKVGETFIKIGVGKLVKPEERAYDFATRYKIAEPGRWQVESGEDWIQFTQDMNDDRGWGYHYVKSIGLLKEPRPGFTLIHTLKNTGKNVIDLAHYNHNFTTIDDTPIGKDYRLIFNFAPRPIERQLAAPARFNGRQMVFDGPIADGQSLWVAFDGFKSPADNTVTICNDKTGAAIRIVGDEAPTRFVYYGTDLAACPEVFTPIKLDAGHEKKWTIQYLLEVDER